MKIVVLDGYTLNPGDLSWENLRNLGEVEIYDRSTADEVVPRATPAQAVLTNKTVLTAAQIDALADLKYIGVLATGYNVVDVQAAKRRGIVVTNVPTYGTRSVAQMTFALLLELTQHVGHHAQTVRDGRWATSADFCYWDFPLIELEGLTMGIVGFGRIGQAVAHLAEAFGMNVLSATGHPPARSSVTFVSVDDLFARSDVVSLHCPLTDQTRNLVNQKRLASMKPTAFLLNTSRGPLIDETALANALNQGVIAGAALDVLGTEPPAADNPLFKAKNCYITPHIAWATRDARSRLLNTAVDNLDRFMQGNPANVVKA